MVAMVCYGMFLIVGVLQDLYSSTVCPRLERPRVAG